MGMSCVSFFFEFEVKDMNRQQLLDCLADSPVIAAVGEDGFEAALASPAEVVFCLRASILTIPQYVKQAHAAGKMIFVHIDLADGVGRDRAGLAYLGSLGVDGVISTRTQLVRAAREEGLLTVQRFFALDSQGLASMEETLGGVSPDLVEIMPGVIGKVVARVASGKIPVIAGGLIETKDELLGALSHGALAVSTGKKELWYM